MVRHIELSKGRNLFTDIQIITDGDNIINTHKMVLSITSELFYDLLSNLSGSNSLSSLKVAADYKLLKLLIDLLYTDQDLLNEESEGCTIKERLELVRLIDFYQFAVFPISKNILDERTMRLTNMETFL